MKPRFFSLLFVTLISCTLPLHALEFRLISWEGAISGLKYSNGKIQVAINASEGALSSPYHFESSGPLILYREVEQEGKTVREPVATLNIPQGLAQAIILLAYADATRKTYDGIWINDSFEARPPQTITYRNLTSYSVAVKLGAMEHTIPSSGTLTQITDPAVERLVFKAAAQTDAGWKVVASTVQPVRPGLRTLVLLRDGRPNHYGIKELVDMLMFNDYPPPLAPSVASR